MAAKEIEFVENSSVACHGREAPYDHPLVYLEIKAEIGKVDCPYCGKEFMLRNISSIISS